MPRSTRVLALTLALTPAALSAQSRLTRTEQRMRDYVARTREEQIALLERTVNIPSGTLNAAGVRRTGDAMRAVFDSLGFRTRWIPMDSVQRAGHLVAEHAGRQGRARLLLIGHLDTVFEGEGQGWTREDTIGRGAGSSDMKGGNVILVQALRAMQAAGTLKDANIIVVFTGDEEKPGEPLAIARRDLIEAARRSDIALGFEGGNRSHATVARRGSSSWRLTVTGRQAHSGGIFDSSSGYGAVFEAARIVNEFRTQLAGEQYLTFNPSVVVGGTDVAFDTAQMSGTTAGKDNIIARSAVVSGDLRFLSEAQKEKARERMRAIVARSLPGTSAEIVFADMYPAMPPTPGNHAMLAVYDSVSRALGYGAVEALDPGRRGAGDISFVASLVDGLDGLGALGAGGHSPREQVSLPALTMQTERAALLLSRLSRRPAGRVQAATGATP